ncbi:MAG: hypothetical protein AAFY71_15320 [Bacteroidota bacterium]
MLVFISASAFAQTSDEIQISAAFSSSIDLAVTEGDNIAFTVASLEDYTDGLSDPTAYNSKFVVNSSVNFKVDLTATPFDDGNGNILNANNFGYTISDAGSHVVGTNHLLLGASSSPSEYALLGNNTEVVTSTGEGNAGDASQNAYQLKFELGTAAVRAKSGLPRLLDQNVAPATYASTVTLTASAMP